jgi:hypothetical protein
VVWKRLSQELDPIGRSAPHAVRVDAPGDDRADVGAAGRDPVAVSGGPVVAARQPQRNNLQRRYTMHRTPLMTAVLVLCPSRPQSFTALSKSAAIRPGRAAIGNLEFLVPCSQNTVY